MGAGVRRRHNDQNGVCGGTTGKLANMDITDEDKGPVGDYGVDEDDSAWHYLDLLKESGKDPFSVCQTGVGSNAIFWYGCLCRIHKKYSGI